MKLCEQTYEDREKYIAKMRDYGVKKDHYTIDHIEDLVAMRDRGLHQELGFPSVERFAYVRLGMAPSTVRERNAL